MAFSVSKLLVLALVVSYFFLFQNISGIADEDVPQTDVAGGDPAQVVANALLCFNDRYIYSSCEESYRLTQKGDLDVPPEQTDQYCDGPCLAETNLVLDCIENIFLHFEFYNRATIRDVRDTIHAACGYGPERGNFNVAEHLKTEESSIAQTVSIPILFVCSAIIIGLEIIFG